MLLERRMMAEPVMCFECGLSIAKRGQEWVHDDEERAWGWNGTDATNPHMAVPKHGSKKIASLYTYNPDDSGYYQPELDIP